ncbi:MAG: ChrR family anti-sigma-E factor [Methyloceanibacter sp.]|nr:ChrR family anti-sigma-E factor [Methyloceanibacter sp.]
MKIVHHPDSATLVSYAAGNLDEGFATLVAAHIASCEKCQAALREIERVGGALLDTVDATPMSPTALERTLSRLDSETADEHRAPRTNGEKRPDLPAPLARLLKGGLDDIAWKTVAPGVSKHPLPVSRAARSRLTLLKIAPGTKVPDHGHGGMELTLVLKGSYCDAFGRFAPGDLADLDEHVEHQPIVDSPEPCVCVVATEAPTRFKNVFGRILQPIVGI